MIMTIEDIKAFKEKIEAQEKWLNQIYRDAPKIAIVGDHMDMGIHWERLEQCRRALDLLEENIKDDWHLGSEVV